MSEVRLDVAIGSSGATSGGNAVNNVVNQIKSNFIDLSAKLFVAQRALDRVWDSAKRGAEATETIARLNTQMRQFGSSADVMANAFKNATQQQLSLAQAASLSSRALAVGLNPNQILVFAEAAEALSDVTGRDLPSSFDELTQAAITGRGAVLANLGVYVDLDDEMKKLAFSTGRTIEQLTRQDRAMVMTQAITEKAKDAIKALNGELSDADRISQIETRWTELWDNIDKKIKSAVLSVVDYNQKVRSLFDNPLVQALFPASTLLSKALSFSNDGTGAATPPPTFGPGKGGPGGPGGGGLSPSLRAIQLQGAFEREGAFSESTIARSQIAVDRFFEHYADQLARGVIDEKDLVLLRTQKQLEFFEVQRTELDAAVARETAYHKRVMKETIDTTDGRIKEEERHKTEAQKLQLDGALLERQVLATRQKSYEELTAATILLDQRRVDSQAEEKNILFDLNEEGRAKDLQAAELYYRGLIDLASANFATDQTIANKERTLLKEQLAFKLRLTRDEIEQVLQLRQLGNIGGSNAILGRGDPNLSLQAKEGILNSGSAQDIRLREREQGNFFVGWARGLQDYTQRTQSAFNFANDMARRTAQTMESGFQQFFFDPLKEGWSGVLDSMLNLTRQVLSQIAAQFVTSGILNIIRSFAGGGGATAVNQVGVASDVFTGAMGGVGNFNKGGELALLHGPEAVVPLPDGRSIPVAMRLPGGGSPGGSPLAPMTVNIINQAGADVQTRQNRGPDGTMELEIMVAKAVNRSISEGRMDKSMRSRFGLAPGER